MKRMLLSYNMTRTRARYKELDQVGLIVFKGGSVIVLQHSRANLNLIATKPKEAGVIDFNA
jgi:hypothetical protein